MRVILTVTEGPHQGREFSFDGHETFIVGRGEQAHFRLPEKDKFFSRVHFVVEVNPPHCRIMDLGSRNGTLVNGEKIEAADLKDGDEIRGGKTLIRVAIAGGEPTTASLSVEGRKLSDLPTLLPQPPPRLGSTVDDRPSFSAEDCDVVPIRSAAERQFESAPARTMSCQTCGSKYSPQAERAAAAVGREPLSALEICPTCLERMKDFPQPVADYRIVYELGRGGMGVVYLAIRPADGRLAAIKMILPNVVASPRDVEKFLREARVLCELDHPNIVAFREMGEVDGQLFFAMDYVPGLDASRLVKKEGRSMAVGRACALVGQMLQALDYAHAKGFVHRDIKPSNLLVSGSGGSETAKLADFGLARTYQTSRISGLTVTGKFGGTVEFMAPEQITNFRDAKPTVDLYAAGATLYFLLAGRFVYDFPDSTSRKVAMLLQRDPVPIRSRRPDLPAELVSIIDRSLARSPSARFPDAKSMRRALMKFCD